MSDMTALTCTQINLSWNSIPKRYDWCLCRTKGVQRSLDHRELIIDSAVSRHGEAFHFKKQAGVRQGQHASLHQRTRVFLGDLGREMVCLLDNCNVCVMSLCSNDPHVLWFAHSNYLCVFDLSRRWPEEWTEPANGVQDQPVVWSHSAIWWRTYFGEAVYHIMLSGLRDTGLDDGCCHSS